MGGKGYKKKEVKHKHYRKGGGGDEPNRNRATAQQKIGTICKNYRLFSPYRG